MLVHIHPENPEKRKIQKAIDILQQDGIIIYPTDTVYGMGCSLHSKSAIDRLCQIKNIQAKKAMFSVMTDSLNNLSLLSKSIDTATFRFIKSNTPGPYTFVLPASKEIPHYFNSKRKTIGIRIPDNTICRDLCELNGHPVVSTSLPENDRVEEYTDPELIYHNFGHLVDMVIDGGPGGIVPSTVLDCTGDEITVIREGKGAENL